MRAFISHVEDREEFLAGDQTLLRELLHPDRDAAVAGYSLAQARLEPGSSSLPHRLAGSELYYVLSGRGQIAIDDDRVPLIPGSVVLVPESATQHVENSGTEDLVFLCVVEPPWTAAGEDVDEPGDPRP